MPQLISQQPFLGIQPGAGYEIAGEQEKKERRGGDRPPGRSALAMFLLDTVARALEATVGKIKADRYVREEEP